MNDIYCTIYIAICFHAFISVTVRHYHVSQPHKPDKNKTTEKTNFGYRTNFSHSRVR